MAHHKTFLYLQRTISLLVIAVLLATSASAQERTKKTDRLLNKAIAKVWKDQSIQQHPIDTKKDIMVDIFFNGNQLIRLEGQDQTEGYLLIRRGFGCKIGGCGDGQGEGQVCSADGTSYEVFDYAMILDTSLTVLKVVVVDYPGDYGYEITSKGWLKQFNGYKGTRLRYGKEVDAISGATISANSITADIVAVHEMLSYFLLESSLLVTD